MVKQWVIFRDNPSDRALRQLLRSESYATGASMSAIVRDALAVRYHQKVVGAPELEYWLADLLPETAEAPDEALAEPAN